MYTVGIVHFLIFGFVHCSNVLFLPMPQSQSHRRSMYPLAEALAENGHNVTIFSEICTTESPRIGKFEEKLIKVNIKDQYFMEIFVYENSTTFTDIMWNKGTMMSYQHIIFRWKSASLIFQKLLDQKYSEFLNLTKRRWDLIFIDGVFAPNGVALSSLLSETPYVIFNPSMITSLERYARNIPNPSATFPPMYSMKYFDQTKFLHRFHSAFSYVLDMSTAVYVNWWFVGPAVADVSSNASINKFYQNPTASFIEYPQAFTMPEPRVPDMIIIGGKCKKATLRDDKLLNFINSDHSKGTIVVAFGHMVKWNLAPMRIKESFADSLNSFSDYRIVWQYEGVFPANITLKSNIKLMPWLPQTEILNHEKTKLFISHGGLKSITEAVCGEVPALVVPFFGDQKRNALLFEKSGSGIMLSNSELTANNLRQTISKILTNVSFKKSVTKLKTFFNENPLPPNKTSIFWAEYIIRHKGLPKLWFKHKGYDMLTIKYFLFDFILLFCFSIYLLLII